MKFGNPKHAARRSSRLRGDFRIENRLVLDKLISDLEEDVCVETNWRNHLNNVGRPRYTLANHDRRADHVWGKCQPFRNERAIFVKRQMAHGAMLRENIERLMGDVEES